MKRKNLKINQFACQRKFQFVFAVLSLTVCSLIFAAHFDFFTPEKVSAENVNSEIETALFTTEEFFGEQAFVPRPTAEARENLARLYADTPDNFEIAEKLAELDEKLEKFDEAENILIRLSEKDAVKLEELSAFYHRRAEFEKEAETLRKILFSTAPEKRGEAFQNLIETARLHDLKEYLSEEFYASVIKENQDFYPVVEKIIDQLVEEENYDSALKLLREAKPQFSEQKNALLEKEVETLLKTDKPLEAEKVYRAAFDPFWSEDEARKFYDFLNEQNRLRAYGAEMKNRFKNDPADFDAAVHLALYRNHDYEYGNDDIAPVIAKIEQAKKDWTTNELLTVTRLTLQSGDAQTASRFLYTLYLREDFQQDAEMRARVLYQLFEMFSDAESEKLPITKGDFRFYEDIARADTNPGIATGILSLIFSDTKPAAQLEDQETKANKFFNRAAAYRIFEEYKRENLKSNELAQMYLDIVRLYAATGETEIAEKTLDEFAGVYENSNDYPATALKLADAYFAAKQEDKTREVYQKVLDYLGKKSAPQAKIKTIAITNFSASNNIQIAPDRNDGISIPNEKKKPDENDYHNEKLSSFRDYLGRKNATITYPEVLEKLVTSYAKEKKTAEILAVYSNEIAKYPDAEWLYEQRLDWLEQTNLTEEKLQAYKTALARFQTSSWRDKLARFFLRENRRNEFAEFSETLVGQMNDEEVREFFAEFAGGGISASDFDKQLFLKLYSAAHERFPRNLAFVSGLLNFYQANKRSDEWRKLAARYYFESPEVRKQFLDDLARRGDLRSFLEKSKSNESTIYELFRADASVQLSNYENALAAYRKLNQIYPHETAFEERLIALTRSFGQKNRGELNEAAEIAQTQANYEASRADYRTRSGEIRAELGDYDSARNEWNKLIKINAGDKNAFAETATVFWDYYNYDDALRTIKAAREKFADDTLYAFETGAIYESQHKLPDAVGEYVKALGVPDETQKEKSKRRLIRLTENRTGQTDDSPEINDKTIKENAARNDFEILVAASYAKEFSVRNNPKLSLGYAEYLAEIKQAEKSEQILNPVVRQSRDENFLEAAREFYQTEKIKSGEQTALAQLGEISRAPRDKISYRLLLAESFKDKNRTEARNILLALVREFPMNYGVLTETADFSNRLGFGEDSARILQNALSSARGAYRGKIAAKLSARLVALNRLNEAEQILSKLHTESPADTEIFRELAKVCVRTGNAETMRKAFAETVKALKETDADRRELDEQIADLRTDMIDAFTRLKDYKSAIAQYIEIINREPDDEEKTDQAIRYVQRYGGAQILLDYYLKVSAEVFKNYRWNVVLARIYAANNDTENAAKNYQTAIINQPEMPELYLALADVEIKRNNTDEALKNLDEALNLTNDAPEYVRKKIEILKRAGREREAETERAKLSAEAEKKINEDEFAEARKLAATEKEKARELYRAAFDKLLENPVAGEMKSSDLSAYVESMRETEPLGKINARFWTLRENLVAIREKDDSTDAGEARRRIGTLDGAIVESIGKTCGDFGTDDELAALHQELQNQIEKTSFASDKNQTLSLVQNFSRRAGFGDLEELILRKKISETNLESDRQVYLQNLVNFYNERGAYQKSFDALEKYGSGDLILKAEAARLVGNREKELEALRAIYWRPFEKPLVQADGSVARYLDILYAENREELKSLTEKPSAYEFQLINFLLAKGAADLAHEAIVNSQFSLAWKAARNAETSLALGEFSDTAECYFCDALRFENIGDLIYQTPDKKSFLTNDDWFKLTREYGEWLSEKRDAQTSPDKFLPAMTENLPDSADEQAKLGEFYLDRNEFPKAVEHFRLALELDSGSLKNWTLLGAAYDKIGKTDYAEECWRKSLVNDSVKNAAEFFGILQSYGLAKPGREKIVPFIVKFLQETDADRSEDFQNLIRKIAGSFTDETGKSAYFLSILKLRPTDTSLAAMIVNENLIAKEAQARFYELLIVRSGNTDFYDYDYDFRATAERVWMNDEAEAIYAQENDYEAEEPDGKVFEWQRKYLHLLIDLQANEQAVALITEINRGLNNRYVRPNELRLAEICLAVRAGKYSAANAEMFTGIRVPESTSKTLPPNLERFNEVVKVLREEKSEASVIDLSEKFFARQIALGQFSTANFVGLARALFQKNEREKALRILHLMIAASDEISRPTALAEIFDFAQVKAQAADATKASNDQKSDFPALSVSLRIAAEIAAEFREFSSAIDFRRQLIQASSNDFDNKIELAKLLLDANERMEAISQLLQIENDRTAARAARWQARQVMIEAGEKSKYPNVGFDAFSQFYNGVIAVRNGQSSNAASCFVNSLIADKNAAISGFARLELMKAYALSDKPFAALKIAGTDSSEKADELLELLSLAAEKTGDFARAIEFEKVRRTINAERLSNLKKQLAEKNLTATDFTVDEQNTRKL